MFFDQPGHFLLKKPMVFVMCLTMMSKNHIKMYVF